jgi:hypothetical protein
MFFKSSEKHETLSNPDQKKWGRPLPGAAKSRFLCDKDGCLPDRLLLIGKMFILLM